MLRLRNLAPPKHLPLDSINQSLRDIYFPPGNRRGGPSNDTITVTTAAGKPLLTMWRWSMFPNRLMQKQTPEDGKKGRCGLSSVANFDSPTDEHYYGLGQQQHGFLDLRDHRINCWHDYGAGWRRKRLRSFHGVEPRLRPYLGQPVENHHRPWVSISRTIGRPKWEIVFRSL